MSVLCYMGIFTGFLHRAAGFPQDESSKRNEGGAGMKPQSFRNLIWKVSSHHFYQSLLFTKSQVARLVGASSHAPKVCRFDHQSGPIPRLWVQSLVRAHMEGNWSMFLSHIDISFSLSPSLPVSLKSIIKNILRWALKEFFLKVSESSQNSKKQDYTRAETSGGGVAHWDVS